MSTKVSPCVARVVALCASLALAAVCALAQTQATTGDIEGRVLDPNGAVVPGATVTARNKATGFEKTSVADDDGNYRLILLPPGTYTVRASATNFSAAQAEVNVTVGSKTPLDLARSVAGTAESINVTAEPPAVETTRTSVATTINERAIENLPINGRNFQDFATLSPATRAAATSPSAASAAPSTASRSTASTTTTPSSTSRRRRPPARRL